MDIILITSGIIALAIVAAMPHLEAHEACRPDDELNEAIEMEETIQPGETTMTFTVYASTIRPADYPDCGQQQSAGGQSKPGRAGAEAVPVPLLRERGQ